MTEEEWEVNLVHGPDDWEIESFPDLDKAKEWAKEAGSNHHPEGLDCLSMMKQGFEIHFKDDTGFQYGTNYHWATFELKT